MDNTDIKILNAINRLSPKTSLSPVKVGSLKLDETELGICLMLLKKSGRVDIMISDIHRV